jgi:GT2 family glycosyltransferase
MIDNPRIAVVLLNYNSEEDLFISVDQIHKQKNIDLVTIVVDNASNLNSIEKIQKWSKNFASSSFSATTEDTFKKISNNEIDQDVFSTFFIYNQENNGYSAGNNIGIRLADYLNVDAVLIANPDMRFEDENYVYKLTKTLLSNESYAVASSRIVGLDGKDQTPLRESSFLEEALWPLSYVKRISYVLPFDPEKIIMVPKTMGCCLLLRMTFLNEISYFDEGTFLYSEEPILATQVRNNGCKIVFNPTIKAIHAHKASEKDNSSKRMFEFIKSRKYYLANYSGYSKLQLRILKLSYSVLGLWHLLKSRISN